MSVPTAMQVAAMATERNPIVIAWPVGMMWGRVRSDPTFEVPGA